MQTNWMGYIAVATDEGKKMLGRRDIVVAWRGTLQPYEWANDFDFPLESAVSVFPASDSKDVPRIGSGWLDVYTASDSNSPYDTTSARDQVCLLHLSLQVKHLTSISHSFSKRY